MAIEFPPQASAGWVRLLSEPCLPQPSFGLYKPESQDLLLCPARVRGCTSAGTRPVASMVRPPERTGAARSHDFGNEVSHTPEGCTEAHTRMVKVREPVGP